MSERNENWGRRESLRRIEKTLLAEIRSHRESIRALLPIGGEVQDIDGEYLFSLAVGLNDRLVELRGVEQKIAILSRELE
ncbi:MAG: hypothetical protein PHN64_04600 [Desulfovibrionaceae bacterium]|nr:hypothetical protein [Desulfovibrionaceae bacterium]